MEDAIITANNVKPGVHFFGVFDGHGGNQVADFVKENLIRELKELDSFKQKKYEQAFKDIYMKIDQMIVTPEGD